MNIDKEIEFIADTHAVPKDYINSFSRIIKQLIHDTCLEVIGEDETEIDKDDLTCCWCHKHTESEHHYYYCQAGSIDRRLFKQRQKLKEILE